MSFTERLLRFSIRNTAFLVLLALVWTAIAAWSYFALPVTLLPNLNFPTLSIVVENPGLTAEELERQVVAPVEAAMSGIYNVSRIRSASVANLSLVTIQLKWGADLENARQQVLQKIAGIEGSLPSGSTTTLETLSNTLGQVQGFVFSGAQSLQDLHEFAQYRLRPLLLQQDGVFQVLIFGGLVPEYTIFISPSQLERFDLTLKDLREAIVRNNIARPTGILDLGSQSFAIVPKTQLSSIQSIENTLIAVKNNALIRIKDIGRVRLRHLPYRGGAEHGDQLGVVIEIVKQPDADTVAVTRRIDAFMESFKPSLPPGVTVSKYYDQSELVLESIHGVEEAVILGALLVGIVLLVFLRSWRASLVAFTSIPTSLLSALVFMHILGMSLNIMTLGAIAIATGMVIDDAIVVIENFFRHRALAPDARLGDVFMRAAHEVAGPVAGSTITTVAIFVPLIFLSGLAGRLFSAVGAVVTVVMMASLFFAFTLIPSIGPHLLEQNPVERGGWSTLPNVYLWLLDRSLRLRWVILGVALCLCIGSGFLLTRLNREFLPLLDEGSILMTVDAPPSSSLSETLRVVHLLIKNVFHDPDIASVVSKTGHAPGMQDTDTMNHSDVIAKLVLSSQRKSSIEELFSTFRKRAESYPGVSVDFTMPLQDKINDAIGGVSATLGVKIFGDDLGKLQEIANTVSAQMGKIPGVVDLHPGSIAPVPSLTVSLHEGKSAPLGISREDLSDVVEAMSFGLKASEIREVNRQIPLTLRMEGTDDDIPTLHLAELQNMSIRTADGPYVPLSQVADIRFTEVAGRIEHEHAQRFVTISCNVSGVNNQTVIEGIRRVFSAISLPPGYQYEIGGSYTAQAEATGSVTAIGIAALVLVTLILWIEFQSTRKTFLILLTIPLSTIGASFALSATQQSLNVSSLIGLVMLIGIVLRNGIVLIDYIHYAIERGVPLDEAIKEGAQVRLRPILMTALSEILGLTPLALGIGAGSVLERPLAVAVIGGLITSTFLTLFVLPLGYRILYGQKASCFGGKSKRVRISGSNDCC